jgi:hypothetical protein
MLRPGEHPALFVAISLGKRMRATKFLLASGTVVFAVFFFDAFRLRGYRVDVIGGRDGLQTFEFFGAVVSLYLLSRSRLDNASLLDWLRRDAVDAPYPELL